MIGGFGGAQIITSGVGAIGGARVLGLGGGLVTSGVGFAQPTIVNTGVGVLNTGVGVVNTGVGVVSSGLMGVGGVTILS